MGLLIRNGIEYSGGSSSWSSIEDKPFETLGDGLIVDENGILSAVGGSGGAGSGNVYSTEEQVIGTWIDGKTMYQKTIVLDIPNGSGTLSNVIPPFESICNIEMHSINTEHYVFPGEWDNGQYCRILIKTDTKELYYTASGYTPYKAYITVRYTKTADYTIETTSTGGLDASVSINGTTYLFTSVNTTPAIIDDALQLSYGGESSGWQLKALVPIINMTSGMKYGANEIISSWLYNSSVKILLNKV